MAEAPRPSSPPPFPPLGADNPLANPALLRNPYALYAMLRANNPVFRVPVPVETGAGVWLLTRHADVERALRDRVFSVNRRLADVFRLYADRLPVGLIEGPAARGSMLMKDPPEHTRLRALVSRAFTPRRVEALRPRVETLVSELLDAAAERGEIDVIRDLAEPLPAIVIAELLGVPSEDHRRFRRWSSQLIEGLPRFTPEGRSSIVDTVDALVGYLRDVVTERRAAPRDDLLSALVAARDERDALSEDELLANALLLLVAGHETTTNLIGNGTLALLRHPDQWERLRREPALVDNAVEELLRYDGPVQATVRVPLEDVELGDQTIGAHALVICGIGAAGRDPAVHPEPDRLDLARDPIHQLAFGFGTHFCLGASLARLEAGAVFAALRERFRALELAVPDEALEYRPNPVLRGLRSLPVRLH